ncbi:hypothetical protein FDH96_gp109 [Mycobacterium phage Rey]|uniref:Uncharacterized protein n=1 Tax=Mycobacterium phage Rey TaxID=1034115 RepID=G1D5L0_9CAUD|nr:hypothetical protein FDH96_gp109 [Mycobacterium phage Rey]AEK10058.1 hypothetical protein PBI_REY_170 [Mycobacterium phage Rey]
MSQYQTMLVWQGISMVDGVTPIVVLASVKSKNRKTGNMVQTWILRADMPPNVAIYEGQDTAVCGDCPFRSVASGGNGVCYVNPRTPTAVWRAWERGNVLPLDLSAFAGRKLRIGAYGDPVAAPFDVWQAIADASDGVTGYTHQWRKADPRFSQLCMASCDSVQDYRDARKAGWRGFVPRPLGAPKPVGLVECPATVRETVQCITCMQCGGNGNGRSASISIEVHGVSARKFQPVA